MTQPYNKGEKVPDAGEYVCVPCGYHHTYAQGEQFGECMSCLAGSQEGDEEFADGLEMWERAKPVDTSPVSPPSIEG